MNIYDFYDDLSNKFVTLAELLDEYIMTKAVFEDYFKTFDDFIEASLVKNGGRLIDLKY